MRTPRFAIRPHHEGIFIVMIAALPALATAFGVAGIAAGRGQGWVAVVGTLAVLAWWHRAEARSLAGVPGLLQVWIYSAAMGLALGGLVALLAHMIGR